MLSVTVEEWALSGVFIFPSENGYLEMDLNNNPLRDSLFTEEIKVLNDNILLNDLPGIGFKLNKKIIKKYQVDFFTI